jgi:hypothetical protein
MKCNQRIRPLLQAIFTTHAFEAAVSRQLSRRNCNRDNLLALLKSLLRSECLAQGDGNLCPRSSRANSQHHFLVASAAHVLKTRAWTKISAVKVVAP